MAYSDYTYRSWGTYDHAWDSQDSSDEKLDALGKSTTITLGRAARIEHNRTNERKRQKHERNRKKEIVVCRSETSSLVLLPNGAFRLKMGTAGMDTSPSAIKRFALFRLAHDYIECKENPLPMIAAQPVSDSNMFNWHANLVGPPESAYEDIAFHFKIRVPFNYPASPPKIEIMSYFEHPNVFGKWICLDMLQGQWIPDNRRTQSIKDIGYGWTPAYTMQSILVQLQAFLFDAVDTTYWATTYTSGFTTTTLRSRHSAQKLTCNGCKHKGTKPWPSPLCWNDRLRYMVPSDELYDCVDTKKTLLKFLRNVKYLTNQNCFPKLSGELHNSLRPGSFFSNTLLPWYLHMDYTYSIFSRQKEMKIKKMKKKHCKVIRGLINASLKYLNQKPAIAPNKGKYLQRMYQIECALDIAINYTYASGVNETRTRGYWQWRHKKSKKKNKNNNEKGEGNGNGNNGENKIDDDGRGEGNIDKQNLLLDEEKQEEDWYDFPVSISQQIEALYCKWQADLRKPGELVEILPINFEDIKAQKKILKKELKKEGGGTAAEITKPINNVLPNEGGKDNNNKNKKKVTPGSDTFNGKRFGIITKPKGYYCHYYRKKYEQKMTEEEMKIEYTAYSADCNEVRVMPLIPMRTTARTIRSYMNGPHYTYGKTKYFDVYEPSRKKFKEKTHSYWKNCMIVEKIKEKGFGGKWKLVVHPMPERRDIWKNSEMIDIKRLKLKSFGRAYKAYVKGDDDKHYVIDILKMKCRCLEDAKYYRIQRKDRERSTQELWEELLKLSNVGEGINVKNPWEKKNTKERIIPMPLMDVRKYIGKCGFIDLSWSNLPKRADEEESSDSDDYEGEAGEIAIAGANDDDGVNGKMEKKVVRIRFPKIGQKVIGKVVKVFKKGMFVDIGYRRNAFLHRKQLKCPKKMVDDALIGYFQEQEEKQKELEELEQAKIEESKAKKRKRRKRKRWKNNNKNDDQKDEKDKNTPNGDTNNVDGDGDDDNDVKADVPGCEIETKQFKIEELNDIDLNEEDDDAKQECLPSEVEPQKERKRAFALPRFARDISDVNIKAGDILDLWVWDTDRPIREIYLSQFRPIWTYEIGELVSGHVRSALTFALFIDIGAEVDAFLHKAELEKYFQDRIVFDCTLYVSVGEMMDFSIIQIDLDRKRIELSLIEYYDPKCEGEGSKQNRLVLPDDFDESAAVCTSIFGLFPDDINDLIFALMDRGDLHRLRKVCCLFERLIDNKAGLKYEIEELKCFHTKKTFRKEILGFGMNVTRYPNSSMISEIEPKLDLLSATSFEAFQVRMNAWKEPFGNWLPVYINKKHGTEALKWAKRMLTDMMNDWTNKTAILKEFSPFFVLKVVPALMNTMVVKVMKGQLHESIVALEGYTMFYHLLLAFMVEYPKLQVFIDRVLLEFVNDSGEGDNYSLDCKRNKKCVPSLGEWIALLATSNKLSWKEVCSSYLRECFDRNVKWILNANNDLVDPFGASQSHRLKKSFNACQVSLKLCMFHVMFLRLFRYSQRSGVLLSVEQTKENLDRLHGRPNKKMRTQLQKNVKRIKKLSSWNEFFDGIGVKRPSKKELFDWLIDSLKHSESKGYHKSYWYNKRKKMSRAQKEIKRVNAMFDKFDDAADSWDM